MQVRTTQEIVMKRILFAMSAFTALAVLVSFQAVSQPPRGKAGNEGRRGGPPRFELGQVFPPPLLEELNLTPEQEQQLEVIRKDLHAKLDKLLTDEQKKKVEDFRPRGPGGPGGPDGKGPPPRAPGDKAGKRPE